MNSELPDEKNAKNRDPISGEPGAHPVGVGVGTSVGGVAGGAALGAAASTAAAGAALGTAAGPVGTVVGAVAGGVAGAFAGKAIAEQVNPTVEDAYWRENYQTRPYVARDEPYETYQPAYRFGWEAHSQHYGVRFGEIEGDLRNEWEAKYPKARWDVARPAVHDGWHRIDRQLGTN